MPMPAVTTGPAAPSAARPTSPSWRTTDAGTAATFGVIGVGTWSRAMTAQSSGPRRSTTTHLRFVAPRSRPRCRLGRRPGVTASGLAGHPGVRGRDDHDDRAEDDLAGGLGQAE